MQYDQRAALIKFEREEGSEKEVLPQNIKKLLLNYTPLQNKKGLRHLPVVRGAKVVEVISIRDLVCNRCALLLATIYLRERPLGTFICAINLHIPGAL